ncbi:MAG: hypothetical protein EU532_08905 [Promethearchaeota archaeon]|nr:MAG: hypothetical protein EU532_08905 [Candidatus Lokiarchaeota archaeon]
MKNNYIENNFQLGKDNNLEFFDWHYTEVSERINELSRQLRSFFNYKTAVIQLRYSSPQNFEKVSTRKPVLELEGKLALSFSQYTSKLRLLGLKEDMLAEKLLILLEKVKIQLNSPEINILKEIKNLTSKIWRIIHMLSEFEIYDYPRLLKVVIQITSLLCSTECVFSELFSEFYRELRENYLLLGKDLAGILQIDEKNKFNREKKNKRVRLKE